MGLEREIQDDGEYMKPMKPGVQDLVQDSPDHICTRYVRREKCREAGIKNGDLPERCEGCLGQDYSCEYYLSEIEKIVEPRMNGNHR